jgi:signal transduction histidine kinase
MGRTDVGQSKGRVMPTTEADVHEIERRAEAAHEAAERALRRAREALVQSEQARRDAEAGQLVAEYAEMLATSARHAAEDARYAAEEGRAVAELAAREARQAQENLQNFLVMAAHDLHNPITGILGYAQLLQRKNASPRMQAHAASAIERSALVMSRLIQDLVDAGRVGSGGFPLHPEPTDLAALVREVAESVGQTSSEHQMVVTAPDQLVGYWDPDRLGQVLTNQIGNAIKYSPDGGKVVVQVRREGDAATITVSDQGIGIDADEIDQLFRPFSRLSNGARLSGTGLGLFISHGIVEAHGGRISVESHGPGTGTTFTTVLPLGTPSETGRLGEAALA